MKKREELKRQLLMLPLLRRKSRLDLLLRQRKLQRKKPRKKLLINLLLNLRLRLK
jgi:hypothetical protein